MVWDFDFDSTQITENAPVFVCAAARGWLVFFPTAVWRTDGTPQGTQPLMAWTPPIFLTTGCMPLEREGLV